MKLETRKKVQEACNKLVYQWKREYGKAIENNKSIPKPLTIPLIAQRAGIAAKTIYTTDEYKRISMIAISKTSPCVKEDDIEFYQDKNQFSRDDVKLLIRNIKAKYESNIKGLSQKLIQKERAYEKVVNDNKELIVTLEKYAIKLVELENSNFILKGQIELLNKSTT